ncbi:hypothetical protein E1295_05990 [Nonomuraea mesophila]|uniref:WXG100 family type VII secretion target n=1 Tax=Nonomuraea mesophila TaxID=2530382 RepID=A0A4R5FV05_9ACTN|nr:hypothetical protein [Nonomuraea mesophila]TDE58160.1 hypothetical protein E1295_05990 [Nonomuraea mesophila]
MEVQPEGLSGDAARLHALAGELDTIRSTLEGEIAANEGWERNDEAGRQLAESLEPNSDVAMHLFGQVVTQLSGTAEEVADTGRLAAETDGGMGSKA